MTRKRLPPIFVRAFRWRSWSLAIECANDLEKAGLRSEQVIAFVDTSEVVEYILPNSLLANHFPTRLDLALAQLFCRPEGVFALGPHAREINAVRQGWEDRTRQVKVELEALREKYEEREKVDEVRLQLKKLSSLSQKERANSLVRLIRDNHRWIFAAWRVPLEGLAAFFDDLRVRLRIPSREEVGVPSTWSYVPDVGRVDDWLERLDNTITGRGEPAPNLIDAYALDQLEQIARLQEPGRMAVLFSHSGKILEALRVAQVKDPSFLRIGGVSLVQPPQVALVWHLRSEARATDSLQLTEELERQRERGHRIGALIDDAFAEFSGDEDRPPGEGGMGKSKVERIGADLRKELDELDDISAKWDALQKIRQTVDPAIERRRRGILKELHVILEQAAGDSQLRDSLERELDRLITAMDRLQRQISTRLLLPEAPSESLELSADGQEMHAFLVANPIALDPPGREALRVPSAVYPIGYFRFRDPEIAPHLEKMASALERLREVSTSKAERSAERAAVADLWRTMGQLSEFRNNPEYYLLLTVVYLENERWFQAYDTAGQGVDLLASPENGTKDPSERKVARAELLLTRAAAARAWALATRVELPEVCSVFLKKAVEDCLASLQEQREGWGLRAELFPPNGLDPRCLREVAVILGSARERVFGASPPYSSIDLGINSAKLTEWAPRAATGDYLEFFAAFARLAFERANIDERVGHYFLNTHLYALTELDYRQITAGGTELHEQERQRLAESLGASRADTDPNLVDTIMWHEFVLAIGRRQRGESSENLLESARKRASFLDLNKLSGNRYYKRLVLAHRSLIFAETPAKPHV